MVLHQRILNSKIWKDKPKLVKLVKLVWLLNFTNKFMKKIHGNKIKKTFRNFL